MEIHRLHMEVTSRPLLFPDISGDFGTDLLKEEKKRESSDVSNDKRPPLVECLQTQPPMRSLRDSPLLIQPQLAFYLQLLKG